MAFAVACGVLLAAPASAARRPAKPHTDPPLIVTSHIIAPERVGDFVLGNVHYNPSNRYSGARFRYGLSEFPEARIDLFVYPIGRMPQDQAIREGMAAFRADVDAARKAGYVRDIVFVDETPFPLAEPAEAGAPVPSAPGGGAAEGGSGVDEAPDPLLAELGQLVEGSSTIGARLRMRNIVVAGDIPLYSNGYLFQRQLFFDKVRVSAAQASITAQAFDALADRAARALAAAVEVVNVGGCANRTIEVSVEADAADVARNLFRAALDGTAENCIPAEDPAALAAKSGGARVVRIDFEPSDWNAR